MFDFLRESLKRIEKYGNYPQVDTITSALGPKVTLSDGTQYLLFSSNSYLGLTNNERCKRVAIESIEKYGTGSGASRIVSGTFELHTLLENRIAKFKGKAAGMVLSSGYSTNVSLIPVLINGFSIFKDHVDQRQKVVFSDEFNHASLIDGMKLSKAIIEVYRHNNIQDLEEKIRKYPEAKKLVITDSVFSMDGDMAALDKIVELKKKYHFGILIDEAHATGVVGNFGKGVADYYNVTNDIDVIMGTFSKAFGSIGGYVVADRDIIKILKVAVRGYVFSTALPPADLAVSIEALNIIEEDKSLGLNLLKKSEELKTKIKKMGLSTLNSTTQIIPIIIGDPIKALKFQQLLREKKVIAPCIQWPAVPRESSRIRISLMANHSSEDIEYLVDCIKEIKLQLDI